MDEKPQPVDVNIEEIMQQIRSQILAQRTAVSGQDTSVVKINGKHLSPDFYEHLYQAAMSHNQISVSIHVKEVNIPLIGSMLEKVRTKLHELVVFYVNKSAAQQIQFNTHILQALSLIAQEMENEN